MDSENKSAKADETTENTAELRELSEKELETIKLLRPMDDAMMRALFNEDVPLAQEFVRSIPGYADVIIERAETQKDMPFINGARTPRIDLWGVGSDKAQYTFEIQRETRGADPKRPRYLHAVMDIGTLDKGEDYPQLPKAVVIFLTEEDIFGDGLLFHKFRWHDTDHGRDLDTGQTILYIYAGGKAEPGQQRLAALAKDMLTADPDKMRIAAFAKKMAFLKNTKKGRVIMSDIMLEFTKDAREEGREEGRAEERKKRYATARRLRDNTDWSLERIAEMTDLTEAELADALSGVTA